jgi:hypothetical protein
LNTRHVGPEKTSGQKPAGNSGKNSGRAALPQPGKRVNKSPRTRPVRKPRTHFASGVAAAFTFPKLLCGAKPEEVGNTYSTRSDQVTCPDCWAKLRTLRAWARKAGDLASAAAKLGITCTVTSDIPWLYRLKVQTSPKLVAEFKARQAKKRAEDRAKRRAR